MEIAFDSKELRLICLSSNASSRKLGSNTARALKATIANIRAADNIFSLPIGSPTISSASQGRRVSITICPGTYLVAVPNQVGLGEETLFKETWEKIHRIKVIGIEHDS
jgi:hypothetical protein